MTAKKTLYSIGVFGDVDKMQSLATASGAGASNYYKADDETGINAAFASIVAKITNAATYEKVVITDGVTTMTSTNADLKNVDSSSFTYTRSDGKTYDGPKASNDGTTVTWNMGSTPLADGVTYTVSFRVWPSQAAYDLVAALKNGTKTWDELTDEQQAQIKDNGDGTYSLLTNTTNSLSYDQVLTKTTNQKPAGTTNSDGSITGADGYTYTYDAKTGIYTGTKTVTGTPVSAKNPDGMPLTVAPMTITKVWDGGTPADAAQVTLGLFAGTTKVDTVTLKANTWTATVYIAPGLKTSTETLNAGHDYTLSEISSTESNYVFTSETEHPMLIDGMLTYENGDAILTGTNTRKSTLSVTKNIINNSSSVDKTKLFSFKMTVTDPSNNNVRFSIKDAKGDVITESRVIGATPEKDSAGNLTGYYTAASNAAFTANIHVGETIYFDGLSVGTKYSVAEVNLGGGYTNTAITNNGGNAAVDVSSSATSGSIAANKTSYAVTYTNTYKATGTAALTANKVLSGRDFKSGDAFTFDLADANEEGTTGYTMPTATELSTDATSGTTDSVTFGDITFSKAGTYTFAITEKAGAAGGVSYSGATSTATVTVTDKLDGTLSASVAYAGAGDDGQTFTNTYKPADTTITLGASKTLAVESGTNAPDISGSYTFTLKDANGNAVGKTITNPDGNGTKISFDPISFDTPGYYQYTVTEKGDVKGVANDTASTKTVIVHVVDNLDGTMAATVTSGDQVSSFTNTYSVAPVTVTNGIKLTKALTGANLTAGEFEFQISGTTNDAPMPKSVTTTNDASGNVTFGDITYTAPGVYSYSVAEVNSGDAGYTYDNGAVDVTVTVTDNGDGTMKAETSYGDKTTFNNAYNASGNITLHAMKTLTGRTLADKQFSFKLKDKDGNVLQSKTNDASGSVSFDAIEYSIADMQTSTPNKATKVTVSANVNGSETKPVTVQLFANGVASGDSVTVTTATYDSGEQDKYDADGNEIAYTVKVDDAAVDATTTDVDAGMSTSYDEKTFTYTISEVNDNQSGYTYDGKIVNVTVTVTNDGKGNLTATASYDTPAEFSNSYHATGSTGKGDLGGTKVSNGTVADGQFSFELIDSQGKVLQTVKNAADGTFSFDSLSYDEKQIGTYTYSIVEVNDDPWRYTYDTHVATATVNVTDNGDGTLAVTTSYGETSREFDNPYKALGTSTQLQAKKVLVGRDLVAGEFDFQLTDQSGKTYTAKNAADGTITFPYVSFDEPGTYTFTASEVAGSEANVTYDGSTFTYTVNVEDVKGQLAVTSATVNGSDDAPTFTNTYVEPVVKVPDTGDASGVGVLAALVAGAAAVAAGAVARRRDQE